jgi:hypothetical protein
MDMLRRKTYLVLAMLLFLAVSLNAAAQDESTANESGKEVSFMFVQEAANGTFIKNADGNYTLTLLNVVPYTLYFSDRPEQIAGFAPMERFIAGFCWRSPNAALSLVDADEEEDTVILTITKPLYDNETGTLTYTAKILEDLVEDRFSYHISRADAGIPEKFGRAALFIDDCSDAHIYCCKIEGDNKECTSFTSGCGKVSCNCCWNLRALSCRPCKSDSYYRKKCMEEHGDKCNDFDFASCFA